MISFIESGKEITDLVSFLLEEVLVTISEAQILSDAAPDVL
jgi:hypothetical protein